MCSFRLCTDESGSGGWFRGWSTCYAVVGQVTPVGLNCCLLPGVEGAMVNYSGPGVVPLVPLRLVDLNNSLVDASVRVMGGTDVHSLLNHLQTRLKEFVCDPFLLNCPKLLQVIMCNPLIVLQ